MCANELTSKLQHDHNLKKYFLIYVQHLGKMTSATLLGYWT